MAKRTKRKKTEEEEVVELLKSIGAREITEEEQVINMLRSKGYTEITEEEKKEPWYQEHLKQLERWHEEEVGKPFTVREKQALYGTASKRKSKSDS